MLEQTFNDNLMQPKPEERGVSIIEVLIAVVVLTVGLVSIVGMLAYVSRTNTISNYLNVQATAAQDQVDRLRSAIWTKTTEDPMIAVGGSVPNGGGAVQAAMSGGSETPTDVVGKVMASATYTDTTHGESYTYTLDTSDNHGATVSNTPIGNLRISWQVRQGSTEDLRYVTINVVQVNAPSNMSNGFTVHTIISRS